HLCGNLRHFIGLELGGIAYTLDREREFDTVHLPLAVLMEEVDLARQAVERTLETLPPERLIAPYPLKVLDKEWATGDFLLHLYGHLNYHLGQIDYHRRILG
ncbi:MAG: DinB family protein, partial [Flavobacteriales bacterium]